MEDSNKNIGVLILAAGSSSRLGRPKQLLEIDGSTLLQKAITSALEVSKSVNVVLGGNEKLIRPTISDFPIKMVLNKKWEEGMGSSIRVGMEFLSEKKLDAVLIMLSDQPFVDSVFLNQLIDFFNKKTKPIIASKYGEQLGVPAIFDSSFFNQLKKLQGQKGAKLLLLNHVKEVQPVLFEKGKIDIDTEEDWENFKYINNEK